MTNVRSSVLLLSVFLLIAGTVFAQDPGNRDTVRVAKVATNAGQMVGVPVTVYNDENLGGYSLGFKWNSGDVFFDSISYIGSRLHNLVEKFDMPNNTAHTVLVGMLDPQGKRPLGPGDGLCFTIWFTIAPGAPGQYVALDSAFIPPSGRFVLSLAIGASISPAFVKGQITIGNPPPPPVIVLSNPAFTFAGVAGGSNPTSQAQQILNGGGQTLNWTATKLAPWLVLTPSSGTAPSSMNVAVNTFGLSPGIYSDSVSVSAPGATNTPQKFAVTLTLAVPPPTIKLTPNSFSFQAQQDSANPAGQTLNITNIGQGTLNWSATTSSTWLTLSSYGGTAPSNVTINVDNTGLLAGVYTDSIRISDPIATNNPQYAVVTFEVFSLFPMIWPLPTSIFATGTEIENPLVPPLVIKNNGGGEMDWRVTRKRRWLSFERDTGTASPYSHSNTILRIEGAGLAFGKYYDTVTITSTVAINSPVMVPVEYRKLPAAETLYVSSNIINFSELECGSYPGIGPDSFVVKHGLEQEPLEWTATHKAGWLSMSPTSGIENTKVTLEVSPGGLSPGDYSDTIVISSDYTVNRYAYVFVTFTVMPTPVKEIGLTIDSLLYIYKYYQPGLAHQDVVIYNKPGGGCLDWQATSDASWLTPIPSSGVANQNVDIRSNAFGLSMGRHDGKVTFTADGAVNSPKDLKVVLWVYAFGDANGDGIIDIEDAVYIIDFIFSGGAAPIPVLWAGDTNCDLLADIGDVVRLIDYIFSKGPDPCIW